MLVRFRLTQSERANLGQVARECEQTLAETIREAVNEYVSDYRDEKVFDGPRGLQHSIVVPK